MPSNVGAASLREEKVPSEVFWGDSKQLALDLRSVRCIAWSWGEDWGQGLLIKTQLEFSKNVHLCVFS